MQRTHPWSIEMNFRIAVLAAFAAALAPTAQAQNARYIGTNEVPRPIDVARALAGQNFRPRVRTRGLSFDDGAATPAPSAAEVDATTGTDVGGDVQAGGTLDVAIGFALGSAQLQPQATAQLDAIAEGLKLLDPATTIVIDGHTDATGTPQFNELLSQRRAEAVKHYLQQQHHISAERLQTHGFGQRAPLDSAHPFDPRNRRVQFRLG
ncbi:MAG: OmpA family protein [Dokdonella sp.]|uniref:OmpA family protein n=1 Tax=Dokdonella sp. TaxID=2291710 RepID=UPI0025BAD7AD|nr:OmpA family protein [Dokdonella sp.]MBX3701113.1 OmpA family protein [Dokdonella sp.]